MTEQYVNEWLLYHSVFFVLLSKCHTGTILRSHGTVNTRVGNQEKIWVLAPALPCACLPTNHCTSVAGTPHISGMRVLAGCFYPQNPPVGFSLTESGIAVSFVFSVYPRSYSESMNTVVVCQCDRDCSQEEITVFDSPPPPGLVFVMSLKQVLQPTYPVPHLRIWLNTLLLL